MGETIRNELQFLGKSLIKHRRSNVKAEFGKEGGFGVVIALDNTDLQLGPVSWSLTSCFISCSCLRLLIAN